MLGFGSVSYNPTWRPRGGKRLVAKQRYAVLWCASDAHGGEPGGPGGCRGTIEECRAVITSRITGSLADRKWEGWPEDGDVEAYRENDREGCDGYAILCVCPDCDRIIEEHGIEHAGLVYCKGCALDQRMNT